MNKREQHLTELLRRNDPDKLASYSMTDDATRQRLREEVLSRTAAPAAEPEPITVTRRPHLAATAAVVAILIGGITATSFAAIYRIGTNPPPASELYTSSLSNETETNTDLPDRQTVYGLMLNAPHYYDRISGRYAYGNGTSGENGEAIFLLDFTLDIPALTSHIVRREAVSLDIPVEDVLAGAEPTYTELYHTEEHDFQNGIDTIRMDDDEPFTAEITQSELDELVDPAEVQAYYSGQPVPIDTDPSSFYSVNPANSGLIAECTHPYWTAVHYLTDYNSWQITAKTNYAGRTCLILVGTVTEISGLPAEQIGNQFIMYVDEQTGCLLYCTVYDAADNLVSWLCTQEIHIEASAQPAEPISAENSDALPDQQALYDRMLTGASAYCTRISGRFVRCGGNEVLDGAADFSCTFSVDYANQTASGMCVSRRKTNTAEEILSGAAPAFLENTENGYEKIDNPTTGSQNFCLHPTYYAYLYLTDFAQWSITGRTDFIGRTCLTIEGTVDETIREDCIGGRFTMDVDEATGALLRFAVYDAGGTLYDWQCAQELTVETTGDSVKAIPDQMTLYDLMLNAQDHYNRASGQFHMRSTLDRAEDLFYDFAVDIPAAQSRVQLTRGLVNGEPQDEEIYDTFVTGGMKYEYRDGQAIEIDKPDNIDYTRDEPLDSAAVREYLLNAYAYSAAPPDDLRLERNPVSGMNLPCLSPMVYAVHYLTDFDTWQITGRSVSPETGRTCLNIEGTVSDFSVKMFTDITGGTFKMSVDEATGCLLNFTAFAEDGTVSEYLITSSIAFDEEAEAPDIPLDAETAADDTAEEKLAVYDLMLNSQDHFTRVSGQYTEHYVGKYSTVWSFAVDIPNLTSRLDRDDVETKATPEEIVSGASDLGGVSQRLTAVTHFVTTDGKRYYTFEKDGERRYASLEGSELHTEVAPPDAPADAQTVRSFCMTHNKETDWESVSCTVPAGAWEVEDCLFPQHMAMLYLSDFDTWSVTGTDTFAGRTCTVIEGETGDRMNEIEDEDGVRREWIADTHFTMYVDEATGCLLCMKVYDDESNLKDWLAVQKILFDDNAAAPDTDLSSYTFNDTSN